MNERCVKTWTHGVTELPVVKKHTTLKEGRSRGEKEQEAS